MFQFFPIFASEIKNKQAMKKSTLLLYIVLAVLLLTACNDEKTYRIGVSQCGAGQWREKVNSEMLAAQHLYDQSVEVSIACAYDDTQRQIAQIDSLVDSGIDLLVVAPNESAPNADAIAKVREKDIPVIYFDRKATDDHYTAFIGGSNVQAGRIVGSYVSELGGQQVLEITGSMRTSPAQERHEGFAGVMETHPEVDYVWQDADWSSDKACSIMEERVKTGKVPDIVFCHNDGMATGVYKAVVEQGLEGKVKIIGIDGLSGEGIEYVQLGHQVGSYIYPTHGEKIVRLALDILTGKPYERENILRGMMVTPENVDLVDMNERELMEQLSESAKSRALESIPQLISKPELHVSTNMSTAELYLLSLRFPLTAVYSSRQQQIPAERKRDRNQQENRKKQPRPKTDLQLFHTSRR